MTANFIPGQAITNFPPGSDKAVKAGCRCPVMDNHHGKGIPTESGEPMYWLVSNCPLHSNDMEVVNFK
jgi:hypothetical protein